MPRLNLAGTSDLLGVLGALGMRNQALNGLGANGPVLRAVTQRAVFEAHERGAEAAAVEAATASRSLAST